MKRGLTFIILIFFAWCVVPRNAPTKSAKKQPSPIPKSKPDTNWYNLTESEPQQVLSQYKTPWQKNLAYTYLQLYKLEYDKGNYYRAMAYCLQGIRSNEADKNPTASVYFYAGAALCNNAVKKYKEALEWIQKAIAAERKNAIVPYSYKCILIKSLIALNKTPEALIALNDFSLGRPRSLGDKLNQYWMIALYYDKINEDSLAVRYYLKILETYRKSNMPEELHNSWSVICNNEIARIYLKTNLAANAEIYINNAAYLFKNVKTRLDPAFLVDFYDLLYKYDVATGNYTAAVKNLETRGKLQDSLVTVDEDKQLAELNIQYEATQKEQSIKYLHSQSAIQQSSLETANLQRDITVGGIFMLIIVSSLFYRNYKQKQLVNHIITYKNELLQHLLTEKECMLKEVHHRIKNNLHTVICLLESQALYLKNDALKVIENTQHCIHAMSRTHQKLYQSGDIKTIDMSIYIPELVGLLQDGFDTTDQIQFKLHIDQINLDISHAIPLGLIINEAVANSIKYAFPNKRKGKISISMIDDKEWIRLVLADNGIGMPQVNFETEPESLGLRLMKGLSDDIDADIIFEVDNGTKLTIILKLTDLNAPDKFWRSPKNTQVYA
jgi:two-component sensor histidine kinase